MAKYLIIIFIIVIFICITLICLETRTNVMPNTSASSIVFIRGGQIFLTMLKCTNLFYLPQSANFELADGLGMRFFLFKTTC